MARSVFYQLCLSLQLYPLVENRALWLLPFAPWEFLVRHVFYVGLPLKTVWKRQSIQKATACLPTGANEHKHVTPVVKDLHWLLLAKAGNRYF